MFFHVLGALPLLVIFAQNEKFVLSASLKDKNPDVGLNVLQLVQKYGYPIETHSNIRTSDAYLLDIHRIPHGKNNANQKNKPVVFLMHGLLCSSVDWVVMGPEKSLAYLLADAGYDVWMGNARGNTWSRKHETLNPNKDAKFWDFSWHEIGIRDLPAMIDHVLKVTGEEKLFYVGHSQGTTSFFIMTSERPEYNSKIRLMIALAPIAYMNHMISPFLQVISLFNLNIQWIAKFLGVNEFLPNNELMALVGQQACKDSSPAQIICSSVLFMICGWDSQQLNKTMLPVIISNTPAGAATKQLIHYSQEINSGHFRQYDYHLQNILKYKSVSPPDYRLRNIAAPVGLFYANNDWLAALVDVRRLADQLPNLALDYLVPFPKFNHLDFLFAIDMKELVFDRAMELMKEY